MALEFDSHSRIALKGHPDFDEKWLQDRIADDPSILGIGPVELLDRERRHEGAGRLDLLFEAPDGNPRYEVELMLGECDPSHIIRCIEYWDVERRRYPAYDHVAVLVAEDITGRFLNILSLFAGTIPLVAIQLNALEHDGKILLNCVKVIDQRSLRRDDETKSRASGGSSNRNEWLEYAGEKSLVVVDAILAVINANAPTQYELTFNKAYLGLKTGHRANNFIYFEPRKTFIRVSFTVRNPDKWRSEIEDMGMSAKANNSSIMVTIHPGDFSESENLLRELTEQSVKEDHD